MRYSNKIFIICFIASGTSESPLKMILTQFENDNILTDSIAPKYVVYIIFTI
jgi:hypothetical protein